MTDSFTHSEEDALAREVRAGRVPRCPRCGGSLTRQAVSPRSDVPYVRHRFWLACSGCGRSVVLDDRRAPHP